jgi:predicted ATPase/DNA-binding XRE family transcriptional regulator
VTGRAAAIITPGGVKAMEDTALGGLLRRLRDAAGLTQEELAERAGVSARTISDVERGLREGVYRETAERIATALGLAADQRVRFEAAARRRRPGAAGPDERAGFAMAVPPVPLTRLIGRERELAEIVAILRDRQARLVTLTGMGGIGKTRLALAAAAVLAGDYPDGVCFVPLAQTRDAALVASLVARALGVSPAREPVVDLIASRLGTRRVLLVLDTFERVLDAAPLVVDLLAGCPGLTVLPTSRAALRLRGEREFAVPPLGLAADGPAAALFRERAGAVRHDLDLRGPAAPVVAEICRRLEGVPLAIELAAVRVKHLPMPVLLDHLDYRLGVLTGGPQDLPPRQRAMRDTIAWSYDLLDPHDRALFRRLSVFTGWTVESARQVCGLPVDVLAAVSAMVDHSLVVLGGEAPGPPRYAMLDVVREYAAELRETAGETPELADRHATYYTTLAEEAEPTLRRSGQMSGHRRVDAELPNLRQAMRWRLRRQDTDGALRLAGALWMFWLWQGGFAEGRRWLTAALALPPTGGASPARAKALWGAGWLAYHQGDYHDTAAIADQLLDLSPHTGQPLDRRNGLTLHGMAHMADGRYQEALAAFDEGVAISLRSGTAWPLATSLLNLGAARIHLGDLDRAEELLAEARATYERIGDDAYHARTVRHLATCEVLRAQPERAMVLLRAHPPIAPDSGGSWDLAENLEEFALVNAAAGEHRDAATLAAAATLIRERTGTRPHPFDVALAEPYLAAARDDRAAWDAGWRSGSTISPDDAIQLATGSAHRRGVSVEPVVERTTDNW